MSESDFDSDFRQLSAVSEDWDTVEIDMLGAAPAIKGMGFAHVVLFEELVLLTCIDTPYLKGSL